MDSKSLAKSKRAHSLHHSKKKPSHSSVKSSKAPSTSGTGAGNAAGSGNKALGKQAKERARQAALPTNWDRYEDEFDSDFEDPSGGISKSKASDVVFPKSKGADFRHLIAEAQCQCQSNPYSNTFPSLDDILPGDFELGLGSMLSVRGESMLSWIGDDNFVVEDETSTIPEASFLSLNLNALAEQLAKVDISKRLYIEPDLVPSEAADDKSKASSSQDSCQTQTSETENTTAVMENLAIDFSEKNKVTNQNVEDTSSESTINRHSNTISPNQGLDRLKQAQDKQNPSQDSNFSKTSNQKSQAENNKKLSSFEAAAAEAELDLLLDSLNETKFLDSSSSSKSSSFLASHKETSIAPPQSSRNATSTSSSETKVVAAKLDDFLDDLLETTSHLSNQNNSYHPREIPIVTGDEIKCSSSSSQPVTKSKPLDDFDSWFETL